MTPYLVRSLPLCALSGGGSGLFSNRAGAFSMEIEVDQALQRLADNKALYVNLALSFPKDVTAMTAQFRQHLTAGEAGLAAGLVHKLRGVASTIGARALADVAGTLELQLKSGKIPANPETTCLALEALVGDTITQLEQVVTALRPAPPDSTNSVEKDSRFSADALKAVLAELMPLLERGNMRALSVFAKAQYKFGAFSSLGVSPRLGALADAMSCMDFPEALANCRLIAAELEGSAKVSDDLR